MMRFFAKLVNVFRHKNDAIDTFNAIVHQRRIVRKASMKLNADDPSDAEQATEVIDPYSSGSTINSIKFGSDKEAQSATATREGEEETCQCTDPVIPSFHRRELMISSKLLGRGAFSEVYEVKGISIIKNVHGSCCQRERAARIEFRQALSKSQSEDVPQQRVAIKHLSRRLMRHPEQFYQAALDLSREAHYMRILDHPHILKMKAAACGGTSAFSATGRFDGFFIVTELLHDTLSQRIEEWRRCWMYQIMDEGHKMIMKTQYAKQLACALQYLHQRRIIFRDLKPENIGFLHDSPDTLKLFDFGLCRTLPPSTSKHSKAHSDTIPEGEEETFHMSLAGTPRYLCPEVLDCKSYNLKADVYSFAVVLYEMYSENKPFPSVRHDALCEFVCRLKIRPSLNHFTWPPALKKLITSSWCCSLEKRLSMEQVNETLGFILHDMELNTLKNIIEC